MELLFIGDFTSNVYLFIYLLFLYRYGTSNVYLFIEHIPHSKDPIHHTLHSNSQNALLKMWVNPIGTANEGAQCTPSDADQPFWKGHRREPCAVLECSLSDAGQPFWKGHRGDGKVTDVIPLHPLNAPFPMLVNPSGKATEVSLVHS